MKRLIVWNSLVAVLLFGALASSYWFNASFIGWLIDDVPDVLAFRSQWQERVDGWSELQHPAVIHFQPEGCLCRVLSTGHAQDLTVKAQESGFSVYQLNSQMKGLGQSLTDSSAASSLGPLILITQASGRLAYAGAYSDGVRCTTSNSMVDGFLESIDNLPSQAVIGLDVETCRCK